MSPTARRNFHIPLSEEVYRSLRDEAALARRPATVLARQAIETWLRQKRKTALREAIATYAATHAGSGGDLDPALEAASLELWKPRKQRRR